MSAQNDGGPAFPETRWDDKTRQEVQWCGMTLRMWIAVHASEEDIRRHEERMAPCRICTYTREEARFRYADAMLEASER